MEDGWDAITTRSVSAAAGVQPPTIYRLFGDKDGLLDAVAAHGLARYLHAEDAAAQTGDPIEDLRRVWDLHVEFGLRRPEFYLLAFGSRRPAAARESVERLHRLIARVAATGGLKMSADRATAVMHAGAVGVVLTQLAVPPEERDPEVSIVARENALLAITGMPGSVTEPGIAGRAAALRQALDGADDAMFTQAEKNFLAEWLDRIADFTP